MNEPRLKVAVLIPCLNEAAGIASVVDDFRSAMPMRGKGDVVRRKRRCVVRTPSGQIYARLYEIGRTP